MVSRFQEIANQAAQRQARPNMHPPTLNRDQFILRLASTSIIRANEAFGPTRTDENQARAPLSRARGEIAALENLLRHPCQGQANTER
jgi:hypothetical protein